MRMDGSLSNFISILAPGTSHLSILFHQISRSAISKKPTIQLFNDWPGCNAGIPLIDVNKMSYETYEDALLKGDAIPNVWESFASKIN
jgi:hypothetical protein